MRVETSMIDLRSDTVTRPGLAMRQAMAEAEVGDDVFGEDPTVSALEAYGASLLKKEAALFVPSGTMGNQIAIKIHTSPGDEVLLGSGGHAHLFEAGGAALISGVQLTAIGKDIHFTAEEVSTAIKPSVYYCPKTRLILVEQARGNGLIFPYQDIASIAQMAKSHGLAMHMDGARLFNAVIASGISAFEYAKYFDTVSFCLSKGLGAPVGSLLCGHRTTIEIAKRYRRALGGAMRQAGILAAAGLFALKHHIEDLRKDHEHARWFAESLSQISGIEVAPTETNIVFFRIDRPGMDAGALCETLAKQGLLMLAMDRQKIRAVTHRDVTPEDLQRAILLIKMTLMTI